ncbi:hypothetical protein H9W90_11905 [Polaribacter pectinis]|uniref:Uncharacterized protein n=1 Tax=Polaribacter pectinis TaxID=2738844 RepID=A0A7G9L8E1_9FLAO|nr:hypothetical protein [Polaribacter pectinis]QNM84890.1 hypothetical protein H9W90_11905 [Polaribacter pectinis]
MESFEYTSVHQYLDCVLQNNPNASLNQIKEAKKAYRKLYYSYYRKQKRKNRKEFTLGFYNQQLDEIDEKRGKLSVSKFLYHVINKELVSETQPIYMVEEIAEIHLELMHLIAMVEEFLDETESDEITSILERLEKFEISFSQILKS